MSASQHTLGENMEQILPALWFAIRLMGKLAINSLMLPIPSSLLKREQTLLAFKKDLPVWMDEEYL